MTPQELKNSILQLAIQGRLVEQRPEEQVTEKAAVVLSDVPFDIPETWKWAKLGDCCEMYTGNSISESEKKAKYEGLLEGFDYIGTKDVTFSQTIVYDNGVRIPYDNDFRRAYKGSILMCVEGGSAGRKIAILDRDVCFGNKLCMFQPKTLLNTYVFFFLQSFEFKRAFADNMTGIIGGVSIKKLKDILLPIPPLAEQKRIVAKIEELLPLIERYEKAWSRLEDFNKRFPGDMQKSILQMAIQGKLVEQRPEEGTGEELYRQIQAEKQALIKAGKIKKDKPLPEIAEDEIPFEIPESWKWVRLPEIGELSRGRSQHRPRNDPELYIDGKYPFIQTGDVAQTDYRISQWNVMYNDIGLAQSRLWPQGTLCLTIAANIGDVAILDFDACFPDSVVGFNAYAPVNSNLFMMYGLMCYKTYLDRMSRSTAQKNINIDILSKVAFPLPPLAEQKRIVARLEELLPLCERLK